MAAPEGRISGQMANAGRSKPGFVPETDMGLVFGMGVAESSSRPKGTYAAGSSPLEKAILAVSRSESGEGSTIS